MSATLVWRAVLISLLLTPWLAAQSGTPTSTTTCNLDDGRQVYVRYNASGQQREARQRQALGPGRCAHDSVHRGATGFGEFRDSDWRVHGVSDPGERNTGPWS